MSTKVFSFFIKVLQPLLSNSKPVKPHAIFRYQIRVKFIYGRAKSLLQIYIYVIWKDIWYRLSPLFMPNYCQLLISTFTATNGPSTVWTTITGIRIETISRTLRWALGDFTRSKSLALWFTNGFTIEWTTSWTTISASKGTFFRTVQKKGRLNLKDLLPAWKKW